jgi:hypothetical protein
MFPLAWLTAVALATAYAYSLPPNPGPDWRCGAVWHATRPAYDPLPAKVPLGGPLNWSTAVDDFKLNIPADVAAALAAVREWDRWGTPTAQYLLVTQHGGAAVVAYEGACTAPYGVILDMDAYEAYLAAKEADPSWAPTMPAT